MFLLTCIEHIDLFNHWVGIMLAATLVKEIATLNYK